MDDTAAPPVIVSAMLVRDGMMLMGRRASAKRRYPGFWAFPGGHVETGEALGAALVREVREEVGVDVSAYVPLRSVTLDDGVVHHLFVVEDSTGGEPFLANDEHGALAWVPVDPASSPVPTWRRLPAGSVPVTPARPQSG